MYEPLNPKSAEREDFYSESKYTEYVRFHHYPGYEDYIHDYDKQFFRKHTESQISFKGSSKKIQVTQMMILF